MPEKTMLEYGKVNEHDEESINKIIGIIIGMQRPPVYDDEPTIFDNPTLESFVGEFIVALSDISKRGNIDNNIDYVRGSMHLSISVPVIRE